MAKTEYDTTLARIAGNIAAGMMARRDISFDLGHIAQEATRCAVMIVEQVKARQPKALDVPEEPPPPPKDTDPGKRVRS